MDGLAKPRRPVRRSVQMAGELRRYKKRQATPKFWAIDACDVPRRQLIFKASRRKLLAAPDRAITH
jgi:hypothetical protein